MPSSDEDKFEWRRFDKLLYGGSIHLDRDDLCVYYMDRSRGDYSVSKTNQLVHNLKITKADIAKSPNRRYYKEERGSLRIRIHRYLGSVRLGITGCQINGAHGTGLSHGRHA